MSRERAHDVESQQRTADVLLEQELSFKDMILSSNTMVGLEESGYRRPSPIQHKTIPLARCGFDVIVQSKAGTGKTLVFTVAALEMLKPELQKPQVLVLAPTREIALQISHVFQVVGRSLPAAAFCSFIGGVSVEEDKKHLAQCLVAVGAPGRIQHLITAGLLSVAAVKLLVLDEADQLVADIFLESITAIYKQLPRNMQVIATSATFPPTLEHFLTRFMRNPMKISAGHDTVLLGVRQMVSTVTYHPNLLNQLRAKQQELIRILQTVPFKQCLVFSNYQTRAQSLCNELSKAGWPCTYTSGSLPQQQRTQVLQDLKQFAKRIVVSTDLCARGVDAENINLVVNLDLPFDAATYLHRVGRAGRFGSRGLAVTIVSEGEELTQFRNILFEINLGEVEELPIGAVQGDIWETELPRLANLPGTYDYSKAVNQDQKRALDKQTKKKPEKEYVFSTAKAKSISILIDNAIVAPRKKDLKTYTTLLKSFNAFTLDGAQLPEDIVSNDTTSVPPEEISSIIFLDTSGRKAFNNRLDGSRDPQPTTETSDSDYSDTESSNSEVSDSQFNVLGCDKVNFNSCDWINDLLAVRRFNHYSFYIREVSQYRPTLRPDFNF